MSRSTHQRSGTVIHQAHLRELDPVTVYAIAMLRHQVFSEEQGASDADLDGRELEPRATILWIEDQPGSVIGHARVLIEPDGSVRIGRLAVHREHRHDGLGRQLMQAALTVAQREANGAVIEIAAQAYLENWYRSLGFVTTGEPFVEASIDHVPMQWRPQG